MKHLRTTTLLCITIFCVALPDFADASPKKDVVALKKDITEIASRYSYYLDSQWEGYGWRYSNPSSHYNIAERNSSGNTRMQATLASYYQERSDQESLNKIRLALFDGLIEVPLKRSNHILRDGQEISTLSFHDAIGYYMGLQILHDRRDLFTDNEVDVIISNIRADLPWILDAKDTENRALLSAAYSLAIVNDSRLAYSDIEKKNAKKKIKKKVEEGLKSVNAAGKYTETKGHVFSLHYHLVSASMLAYLGKELSEVRYSKIATKMFFYARPYHLNSKLSSKKIGRPDGIGLQDYILVAYGEKYLHTPNFLAIWKKNKSNLGFLDSKKPNRLVWIDNHDKSINDDYSFLSIADLLF